MKEPPKIDLEVKTLTKLDKKVCLVELKGLSDRLLTRRNWDILNKKEKKKNGENRIQQINCRRSGMEVEQEQRNNSPKNSLTEQIKTDVTIEKKMKIPKHKKDRKMKKLIEEGKR